eukprot:m.140244 g.140244  ORF g.140244 m.140244 type:complete len:81 (+) comp16106_c0_seq5:1305-1547(+)
MAVVAQATITALLEHLQSVAASAGMMSLPEAVCISGQATSLQFVQQAVLHVFKLPLVAADESQAQGSAVGACRVAQALAQ